MVSALDELVAEQRFQSEQGARVAHSLASMPGRACRCWTTKLGQVAMALLDLPKLTAGLSRTWAGFLRDWDRSLRSGNYPETTRYNYLLATAQLARHLGEYSPDPDADADPCHVVKASIWSTSVALRSGRYGPAAANASDLSQSSKARDPNRLSVATSSLTRRGRSPPARRP
jgi:hypothetical protein